MRAVNKPVFQTMETAVSSAPRLVPETMPDQPNVLPDERPVEPPIPDTRSDRFVETGIGWQRSPSLFGPAGAQDLRERWDLIQSRFATDPERAAAQADLLLADVFGRIEEVYLRDVRQGHSQGGSAELRRRYRAFFCRLLGL